MSWGVAARDPGGRVDHTEWRWRRRRRRRRRGRDGLEGEIGGEQQQIKQQQQKKVQVPFCLKSFFWRRSKVFPCRGSRVKGGSLCLPFPNPTHSGFWNASVTGFPATWQQTRQKSQAENGTTESPCLSSTYFPHPCFPFLAWEQPKSAHFAQAGTSIVLTVKRKTLVAKQRWGLLPVLATISLFGKWLLHHFLMSQAGASKSNPQPSTSHSLVLLFLCLCLCLCLSLSVSLSLSFSLSLSVSRSVCLSASLSPLSPSLSPPLSPSLSTSSFFSSPDLKQPALRWRRRAGSRQACLLPSLGLSSLSCLGHVPQP